MRVLAIDPGHDGALALVDRDLKVLTILDMPTAKQKIGKTFKDRLVIASLLDYLRLFADMGAQAACVELVGGLPKQSAPAAFIFGMEYGCVIAGCQATGLGVEQVTPPVWKADLKISPPANPKDKAKKVPSVNKAFELWPDDNTRRLFHNGNGTLRPDRCEAALIGYWFMSKWRVSQ